MKMSLLALPTSWGCSGKELKALYKSQQLTNDYGRKYCQILLKYVCEEIKYASSNVKAGKGEKE